MSYEPTTWLNGDTITAQKLNKMEQGIAAGSGALFINCTGGQGDPLFIGTGAHLDISWLDIYNALKSGTPCYIVRKTETSGPSSDYTCSMRVLPVVAAYKYSADYRVYAQDAYPQNVSNTGGTGLPAIITFYAPDYDAFPTFLRGVSASSNTTYISTWT